MGSLASAQLKLDKFLSLPMTPNVKHGKGNSVKGPAGIVGVSHVEEWVKDSGGDPWLLTQMPQLSSPYQFFSLFFPLYFYDYENQERKLFKITTLVQLGTDDNSTYRYLPDVHIKETYDGERGSITVEVLSSSYSKENGCTLRKVQLIRTRKIERKTEKNIVIINHFQFSRSACKRDGNGRSKLEKFIEAIEEDCYDSELGDRRPIAINSPAGWRDVKAFIDAASCWRESQGSNEPLPNTPLHEDSSNYSTELMQAELAYRNPRYLDTQRERQIQPYRQPLVFTPDDRQETQVFVIRPNNVQHQNGFTRRREWTANAYYPTSHQSSTTFYRNPRYLDTQRERQTQPYRQPLVFTPGDRQETQVFVIRPNNVQHQNGFTRRRERTANAYNPTSHQFSTTFYRNRALSGSQESLSGTTICNDSIWD